MSDERHITDEEIHELGGGEAPRVPAGVPQAICLACGHQHNAFYAAMSHDCEENVPYAERRPYIEWLELFRRLGFGVLKTVEDTKFPLDKEIPGRTAITFHLQSDLFVGPGWELKTNYYDQLLAHG